MAADDTRNLIHGLLVQRLGLVTSAAALAAIEAWRGDMSRPLLEVFVERGLVSPASRAVVETVTDQLVKTHGGEAAALTALVGVGVLPEDERTKSLPGSGPRGTRYEILDELAHGGMGQVLRASDAVLGREVLVKQMLGEIAHDPPAQASFARERQTAAALEHPNIGPVYDAGVHGDGRLYYVMRYIRGDTLKQAIQRYHDAASDRSPAEKTLALRDLLGRFSAVCEAVSYAHARGVLHRDIKPANILLGDFGETQLIDWGLAKVGGEEIAAASGSGADSGSGSRPVVAIDSGTSEPTRMGQAKGTPAFMAPEQAAGEIARIGPAADVYGLGATLYQILTGVPPFDGRSPSVMQDVIRGVFPRPRRVAPGVPPALEAICLKAMAREPADRYPSAKALAADVGRWLADEPVGVYRDPWTVRAARFAKRHRTAVTAACVLLATGLVALGVGNEVYRRQRNEQRRLKDVAITERDRAARNAAATADVVDKFLIEIADDGWARFPGTEHKRLEMARLAVQHYRELSRQSPDDTAVTAGLGNSLRRAGNLCRVIHDFTAARDFYAQAREVFEGPATNGTDPSPLAIQLIDLLLDEAGVVRNVAGPVAAESVLLEARTRFGALQTMRPNHMAARLAYENGVLLTELEQYADAAAALREADRIFRQSPPKPYPLQVLRVRTSGDLAFALGKASQLQEASAAIAEADSMATALLASNDDDPNARLAAAAIDRVAAVVAGIGGDLGRASVRRARAIATCEQLAAEFPFAFAYRRELIRLLVDQAEQSASDSDAYAAADEAGRALDLLAWGAETAGQPSADFGFAWTQPLLARAHAARGAAMMALGDTDAARSDLDTALARYAKAKEFNPQAASLESGRAAVQAIRDSLPNRSP